METKFGQFKKLKCPNFVNCPNFVTIFCRALKIKIIFFFYIPSNPLSIAVRNSLTNQFFQKTLRFFIFSKTKCITKEKRRVPGSFSSLQFCTFIRGTVFPHCPLDFQQSLSHFFGLVVKEPFVS